MTKLLLAFQFPVEDRLMELITMIKTGGSILFIFSLAAILLPLFPLGMLLARRMLQQPKLLPLITLCLIAFFKQAMLLAIASSPQHIVFVNAIFNIPEMAVLLLLYRTELKNPSLKQGLIFLLVAVTSALLTIYSLEGITAYAPQVEIFISCLILLMSLLIVGKIIVNDDVFKLRSPLFWIAGGSFCYYAIFLLSEILRNYEPLSANTNTERFILMAAVYMVRYVFYIIAAYVSRENKHEDVRFL